MTHTILRSVAVNARALQNKNPQHRNSPAFSTGDQACQLMITQLAARHQRIESSVALKPAGRSVCARQPSTDSACELSNAASFK